VSVSAETSRLIITLSLLSISIVSIVVGIYVILILKEFRKTVEKTNKIIDDAGVISESVAKPLAALAGVVTGIKEGSSAIKKILSK